MKTFSYSVVIRTLGNTGQKYNALLQSIKKQTIKPEEIIVVIPHGFTLDYTLGYEKIIYSERGMITQRAIGIKKAKSDYILVVDDDIDFSETMVEELYDYMLENNLDVCFPMEGVPTEDDLTNEKENFEWPFSKILRSAFTGQMFISNKESDFLDVITVTAGHKVFTKNKYKDRCYLCQTGNFQCHFIKTKLAQNLHLEHELWLEQGTISSYSSFDDPVYYYGLFLKGARMAYSLRTRYRHLDAGAGRPAKSKLEEKRIRYYTMAKNRTIFWYKYLWKPAKTFTRKVMVLMGGLYGTVNYTLFSIAVSIRPKYWKAIAAMFEGYRHAYNYIRRGSVL